MSSSHASEIVGPSRPLVIKGTERIESIVIRGGDVRRESGLYTPTVSRILRRDFNVTSVKLFFYCKRTDNVSVAKEFLCRLAEEADALENLARPYEMPEGLPFSVCTMRIISDEAQTLFDALHTADRSLFKLMHSPLTEVACEQLIPFMRVYNTLRQRAFGYPVRRPVELDVEDIGQ